MGSNVPPITPMRGAPDGEVTVATSVLVLVVVLLRRLVTMGDVRVRRGDEREDAEDGDGDEAVRKRLEREFEVVDLLGRERDDGGSGVHPDSVQRENVCG